MALRSTVYRAQLNISDLDRHYYDSHSLTLARHPSETDERLMMRLLAFIRHADPQLLPGGGLCVDDEPDLWQKDLTGRIQHWVSVGLPEEKWLKRASARSDQVSLYAYGRNASLWWQQQQSALARLDNLQVLRIAPDTSQALAALAARSMDLQCTVQDGDVWISSNEASVHVQPEWLQQRQQTFS